MNRLALRFLLSVALILACQPSAFACAACFGQSDSAMSRSLNASIFTLMAFIGIVLVGAASFFVFLARKAAATARAEQEQNAAMQPKS